MQRPLAYHLSNVVRNPLAAIHDIVLNYLRNRSDFYGTLLPRVPHERLRALLSETVLPIESNLNISEITECLAAFEPDEFLTALSLRDLLKKPTFGSAWGRTTISVEEALARSEIVEETGFILFEKLAYMPSPCRDDFHRQAQERKKALAAVLELTDALRYHRLRI